MKYLLIPIVGIFLYFSYACNPTPEDVGHVHTDEYPTASYTGWTEKSEIFVEYELLAVNKNTRFVAHFSSMKNFKPLTEGNIRVVLYNKGKFVTEGSVNAPSSPGIFRPTFTPKESGVFDLVLYVHHPDFKDTFQINDVPVYNSEHDAHHSQAVAYAGDELSFTKEQAWKIDFAIARVQRNDLHYSIRTSGEILPVESRDNSITSTTNGLVIFKNNSLVEGQHVQKGTPLFSVNTDQLISGNLSEQFNVLKTKLEKSRKNLERSQALVDKGIISLKEYENRQANYEVDLAAYETMARNYSAGGKTYRAPISGILNQLYVVDGQYVDEGQSLALISSNTELLIEASVSQKYFHHIQNIRSANIKLPWNDDIVSIDDYNGKIISRGNRTQDHFIPVLFKIDNRGDLIPGAYLDIFLLSDPVKNVITIPVDAILKDYSQPYVYVQTEGESFEKRMVTTGINDGKQVQILSGLKEGDMIVTRGSYAIKMASMSSTIPAHGHEH